MRNYFGTDGIRGVAGEELTARTAFALGNALCRLKTKPLVVLGRDTRTSSDMLSLALEAGVCAGGGSVRDGGVLPTAAVAFFVRKLGADFGVVVSASHNPPEFNGLKVFDFRGCKLSEEDEEYTERFFDEYSFASALRCGRRYPLSRRGAYADFLVSCCDKPLSGKKFVLDCANGGAYSIAPLIFRELGAEVIETAVRPDGLNINDGCGATHPENISKLVLEHKADCGIALDGDADRVIFCDSDGVEVNGDRIIGMIALDLKKRGRLAADTVVVTGMSNLGLHRAMKENGISVEVTDVGDRYVIERMREKGFNVGGEQSGHIIFMDYATTGDGIISALHVLQLMERTGKPLAELAGFMSVFPQEIRSFPIGRKVPLDQLEKLPAAIAECKAALGDSGRTIVRYSGTENKMRILVEAENPADVPAWIEKLCAVAQDELK